VQKTAEEIAEKKKKGKELKKQIQDEIAKRGDLATPELADQELFVVLVFRNRDQSDEFLQVLRMPTTEKYISGEVVLEILKRAMENVQQ